MRVFALSEWGRPRLDPFARWGVRSTDYELMRAFVGTYIGLSAESVCLEETDRQETCGHAGLGFQP